MKYIEKLIGDSADEHAKKLEAHKRDLEDHKRNLDDHKMQAQSQKAPGTASHDRSPETNE